MPGQIPAPLLGGEHGRGRKSSAELVGNELSGRGPVRADSDSATHRGYELVQCWVKAAQRVGHVISSGTLKRRSVRGLYSVPAFSMPGEAVRR